MPSITMSNVEARTIVRSANPNYEVVSNVVEDLDDWLIYHKCFVCHTPSGKYYDFSYSRGATEYPGTTLPFEWEATVTVNEVKPVKKLVTVYEPVEEVSNDQV
jgi:hypothetical protein